MAAAERTVEAIQPVRLLYLDRNADPGVPPDSDTRSGGLGGADRRLHINIVDATTEGGTCAVLVRRLKRADPAARIVVINLTSDPQQVIALAAAGASGFVLQGATLEEFVRTVRTVAEGLEVLPPALTGALLSRVAERPSPPFDPAGPAPAVQMTHREQEVVRLIADGLSNKEIASRLNIATNTVKGHVHNILEKLALHTRLQISVYAHSARQGEQPAS